MRKKVNKKYGISAFFPMYNDENTVELMYKRLKEILSQITNDYEIIMIDDCSPDNSGKIADKIAKKDKKVRVIHHEENKGYGGALKAGFYSAKKELVFYTDGDAQYDVRELTELIPFIDEYDIVNGYNITRADKIYRKMLGSLYNIGMHIMFNLKVKQVDCDFRLIRREIFKNIELVSDTGLICTEMMKKIQDAGYTIKNVPVHHYPRLHGQSQFFRWNRIAKTLMGLIGQWFELVVFKKHKKDQNAIRKTI